VYLWLCLRAVSLRRSRRLIILLSYDEFDRDAAVSFGCGAFVVNRLWLLKR
jgi:hypothetical protein